MKKFLITVCTIVLTMSLVACSKKEDTISSSATIASDTDSIGGVFKDCVGYELTDEYIKVITDEYVYESTMTETVHDELDAVDFFDEKRDEKYADILTALPIEKKTLRSEYALTPEKIANLIGKKGQELIDMGYESVGYNLSEENAIFFMECNGYTYNVVTEEHYEDNESFFSEEAFADSTIKDITEFN